MHLVGTGHRPQHAEVLTGPMTAPVTVVPQGPQRHDRWGGERLSCCCWRRPLFTRPTPSLPLWAKDLSPHLGPCRPSESV